MISYPKDEENFPWLKHLIAAYNMADEVTAEAMKIAEAKTGKQVACRDGCSACCLDNVIQIHKVEFLGIKWFISTQVNDETHSILKRNVETMDVDVDPRCPFLIEKRCSVYPVRPLMCRHYAIVGDPCSDYSNILSTRQEDIVGITKEMGFKVAMPFLQAMGMKKKQDRIKAFYKGVILNEAIDLHQLDLRELFSEF